MERQPALTYEEVCEAANLLQRQGRHVTIDALHALLARGSKTTIHKHRERWRSEMQHANQDSQEATALPPDRLKQFFESTFNGLWQAALEAAHEALAELRDEAQRAIATAQAQVSKTEREMESARRESAMLSTRVGTLEDKLERTAGELVQERQQRVAQQIQTAADTRAAAERIRTLDAAVAQADAREAQLNEQMQAAVTELQLQLNQAERRRVDAEQRARLALEAAQREAAQREQALQRALKLAQHRTKAASVAWHSKEKNWIEAKSKLEERLEAERKESSRLEKALTQTQLTCERFEERSQLLDRERVGLEKTTAVRGNQLSEAQRQLTRLERQVHGLLRENARLSERLSQASKARQLAR